MSLVERFPYQDRNPASGGLDLMPDMPILLRNQSTTVPTHGLVDSGALINVLPHSLGLQLGLIWDKQHTVLTLGGVLVGVQAKGVLLEGIVGKLPPVQLGFAWAHSDTVPCLLGQFNFFVEFDVAFFRLQRFFEVCPASKAPFP
jgi:hypothetical protein